MFDLTKSVQCFQRVGKSVSACPTKPLTGQMSVTVDARDRSIKQVLYIKKTASNSFNVV